MESELNIIVSAQNDTTAALESVTSELTQVGVAAEEMATAIQTSGEEASGVMDAFSAGIVETNQAAIASYAELDNAMRLVDETAVTTATEFDTAMAEMEAAAAATAAGVSTDAEAQSAAMADSMNGMKSTATQAGIVGIFAFMGLKNEIETATAASTEWNKTIVELQKELSNTGSAIPLTALIAYGSQLSQNTLYSQQDVLSAEAILMSYKNLQDQYKTITQAAADLAAKTGDSLPQAMGVLTKALADPLTGVRQLQSAHINLSATMVKTINDLAQGGATAQADALLLYALKSQVGGLSEAMSDASGTGFEKLSKAAGALQNIIGQQLGPVLDQIALKIEPIVVAIGEWVEAHPKLTSAILIGGAAFAGLAVALVGIGLVLSILMTSFAALGTLIAAVVASPVALMIGAFLAVGAGVTALAVSIHNNWDAIKTTIISTAGEVATFIEDWYNKIMGWINNILNSMKSIGSSIGGGISGVVGNVENFVTTHLATGGIVSSPTVALIGEAGPEAVIPLSMLGSGESLGGVGGGQGNGINVYITGTVQSSADQATILGNLIAKQINRQLKLQTFR